MNRGVSQAARILGVDVQQLKTWAWLFKDYLGGGANPAKGRARAFTDSDVLALMYIAMHWEDDPDMEGIQVGLNRENHYDEQYFKILYRHTPILQEPPDDLDETWRHGIFLNGGSVSEYLELARNYRQSAEALLDSALKSGEPRDWGYPVLFGYRHCLELYLKIIGEIEEPVHSLEACMRLVEKRHKQRIGSPVRDWIIELDKIDPYGTAFRYADDEAGTLTYAEYWVDFLQFKYAMGLVFQMLDNAVLRTGVSGKSPKDASLFRYHTFCKPLPRSATSRRSGIMGLADIVTIRWLFNPEFARCPIRKATCDSMSPSGSPDHFPNRCPLAHLPDCWK